MTVYVLVISIILITGQTATIYQGGFPDLEKCNEFMSNALNIMQPRGDVKSWTMKCDLAKAKIG